MNPEDGLMGEAADFNNLAEAIKGKCPSLVVTSMYRTPHAGILYIMFTMIDTEDLKRLIDFCAKANTFMTVHHRYGCIEYRLGTNNDATLVEIINATV